MINRMSEWITELITSQTYLQEDDQNRFFNTALVNFFVLAIGTIASYLALWESNDLTNTPLALSANNEAVHATSVCCILICIALLLDLIYDIIYIAMLVSSAKSRNIELTDNWLLIKDIIIKITFIIGLLLPNIGIVATNNLSLKASLYVVQSSLQNCIIALATFFRLLKSNDAILNPTYFICLFCFYIVGQCCDIFNNLHFNKDNKRLDKLYNVFIYTAISGVVLMIVLSFIRLFMKVYEKVKVTIEDYLIVFIMIPFLFCILWIQVVVTYFRYF